jgi:hypothetical protein
VTPDDKISAARARTAGLVRGRRVLAIQACPHAGGDTANLRDDGKPCSPQLYPMIAVDAMDGALIGLVHELGEPGAGLRRPLSGDHGRTFHAIPEKARNPRCGGE